MKKLLFAENSREKCNFFYIYIYFPLGFNHGPAPLSSLAPLGILVLNWEYYCEYSDYGSDLRETFIEFIYWEC